MSTNKNTSKASPIKDAGHKSRTLVIPDAGNITVTDETGHSSIIEEFNVAFWDAWQLIPQTTRSAIVDYWQSLAKKNKKPDNLAELSFVLIGHDRENLTLDEWELDHHVTDMMKRNFWIYDVRAWPATPFKQRRAALFFLSHFVDHLSFFPNMPNSLIHTDSVFYIGQSTDVVRYWETGKQTKRFQQFIEQIDGTIAELEAAKAAYLGTE